jgi:hypothetical protein
MEAVMGWFFLGLLIGFVVGWVTVALMFHAANDEREAMMGGDSFGVTVYVFLTKRHFDFSPWANAYIDEGHARKAPYRVSDIVPVKF